jgi:hypothetical protein
MTFVFTLPGGIPLVSFETNGKIRDCDFFVNQFRRSGPIWAFAIYDQILHNFQCPSTHLTLEDPQNCLKQIVTEIVI